MAKVRADAAKYAETVSNAQRERAATEKYLADQMAAVQAKSRERDTEILRARASGNEELARELEAQQRIARLSAEIFEASRKEGMTRAELEALAGCKIGSAITSDFTNQTVLYVYDNLSERVHLRTKKFSTYIPCATLVFAQIENGKYFRIRARQIKMLIWGKI